LNRLSREVSNKNSRS